MPTIYDVAKHSGVSAMTVSYVLNKPERVAAETRERVRKSIQELNFHPNALARGLRRRTDTLGLVLAAGVSHPFSLGGWFAAVLDSITAAANVRDQNLLLLLDRSQQELLSDNTDRLLDRRCDGMILMNVLLNSTIISTLVKAKIPFVQVGDIAEQETTCVSIDDIGAARKATEYLMHVGHRRIVFAGYYEGFSWTDKRLEGYRQAMEAAGEVSRPPILWDVMAGDFLPGAFEAAMKGSFAERPTAIACITDFSAIVAMRRLADLGLCVPEAVSVIGIDDIPEALKAPTPLTTIKQDFDLLGRRTIDILLGRITGDVLLDHKEVIETELVIRQSVAAILR